MFFYKHKWNYIEYFVLSSLYMFSYAIHKIKDDIVFFMLFWNQAYIIFNIYSGGELWGEIYKKLVFSGKDVKWIKII